MSDHSSAVAHHFDSAEQQHHASFLGMWLFLVTEIMFFGGLFAGYTVYRRANPAAFADASAHLDVFLGGFNTAILIGSSLTMALAVHAAQTGRKNRLVACLLLTIGLGAVFLGVKAVEYSHKYHEHLIPGASFQYDAPVHAAGAEIFFSFYFAMTGMHAAHMVIGIVIMLILVHQSLKGRYTPAYFNPVEVTGLYWHFVDIVWIFLFPLLYLLGRH